MSEPAIDRAKIDELRQQHIGRLLLRAHRAFSMLAIDKLRLRGHAGLSLAHTNLLANLDLGGTRITTLAERLGISKQAVGHLALDLEQRGYVERSVDVSDRRATLLTFTDAGWRFLQDAHLIKREIESEYQEILGEQGFDELRLLLLRLLQNDKAIETDEELSL
ncbi:MAG TPA: MarR family transcriptional regulator [Roseiflexaceae bacterium]|nr:MarR family transcriptional regulator [Roseiflexaceae bacterium]